MITHKTRILAVLLLLGMLPMAANAQEGYSLAQPGQPAPQQQAAPVYSAQQIDQIVAPIALYPDNLVSTILVASTYPLEVVEAYRWQQSNPGVQGDELAQALEQQPWDPSVKSLAGFPQVLKTMNDNLQWTEQLGDVFLAQQAAVSESVQRLRQQAAAAGHLGSTPQQTVSSDGQTIEIAPANPDMVYVPEYNPATVYGAWPYPSYPPYYFSDVGYTGAIIGFGVGVAIIDGFWGWNHWDWRNHRIDVAQGAWHHDPEHRRGVPYHDAATRARFQGANNVAARRAFRGFQPAAATEERFNATAATARPQQPAVNAQARPAAAAQRPNFHAPAASRAAAPEGRSPPMFESFSGRSDVHAQSARGNFSRSTMQQHAAPAPHASAPPQHSGGGDGGHEHVR